MPNTASYVAVEHKVYQTFQMLLFAVFVLDECTARTWLPSFGLPLHHLCGQARRGRKLRVTRNSCGCAPDANPFIVVPGSGEPALVSSGFLGSRAGLFLGPDGHIYFVTKECLWTLRNSAENFILLVHSGSTTRKQAKAYGHVENRTLVVNGCTTASRVRS